MATMILTGILTVNKNKKRETFTVSLFIQGMQYMKYFLITILIFFTVSVAFCEKSMAELNPEFESRIANAEKVYVQETPCFSLFLFSDVHSDAVEYDRMMSFYTHYQKYFDDALCLGDIIENFTYDSNFFVRDLRTKKVLFTMGNHDVFNGSWEKTVSMGQCYNRYYAPVINSWNAVYTPGKTYFYKDYSAKKIRLIVLDSMLKNEEMENQLKWFEETLSEANSKNLSVIAGTHFPMLTDGKQIECCFSVQDRQIGATKKIPENDNYEKNGFMPAKAEDFQKAVQHFTNAGGYFVCWLGGHIHYDSVEYDKKYNQLSINIDASGRYMCSVISPADRTDGTKNQDLADAFIVDTDNKLIKLIRIGCDSDRFMAHRDIMCIRYTDFKVFN